MTASELEKRIRDAMQPEGSLQLIRLHDVHAIAKELGETIKEVELAALHMHILPARYQRNLGTVGWDGQIRLLESTVAVVGAGGLGGWAIDGLARMGVGHLVVVDGDVFEESNLNRQALCWESSLGKGKAEAAKEHVGRVNRAVDVTAIHMWVDADNLPDVLRGAQVVVDALDKLPIRLVLQEACQQAGIPMVHGAIGGYIGQVTTIFPGDAGLRALYGAGEVPEQGAEVEWGNPAATPMMVSSWQIQEVVKIITGRGTPLRGQLLFMDAESGTVDRFQLG